jgi:hypothetical protein
MDAAAIAVENALKVFILGVAEGGGSCIKISGTSKGVESSNRRASLCLSLSPSQITTAAPTQQNERQEGEE